MSFIQKELRDTTGVITFNRDEKRNSLSRVLIDEMISALGELGQAAVRSVVLRAHPGVPVWSAGHDTTELPASGRDPLGYDDPLRRAVRAIETFPAPVIAMIAGSVWGGACELAIICDLVIASSDATFALTPAKLGVPYNTAGIVNMMKSISMPLLKEMLFTAQPISAERALRLGVINQVVPKPDLERVTFEIAARIAETSPLCVALMKEELRVLSESRPLSPETFEQLQGMRRRIYDGADYKEGIRAFREKRKPAFVGA